MSAGSQSTRRAAGHAETTIRARQTRGVEHEHRVHEQHVQREPGERVVHQEVGDDAVARDGDRRSRTGA